MAETECGHDRSEGPEISRAQIKIASGVLLVAGHRTPLLSILFYSCYNNAGNNHHSVSSDSLQVCCSERSSSLITFVFSMVGFCIRATVYKYIQIIAIKYYKYPARLPIQVGGWTELLR